MKKKSQKKSQKQLQKNYKVYGMLLLIVVAALAIYFIYFQNPETFKPALYSLKPTEKTILKKKVAFEDFTGSESCRECHKEQYDMWKNSTHSKAGGEPGDVNIIAKFDSKPLKFKDATVIPKVTKQGNYVFDVIKGDQPVFRIGVDAVVGGGHMYGGGGQSFFTKFPDGSLRCLPFEFISKENIWYVALKNYNWVPITDDISLEDLENWLPHKFLGATQEASNCQNCHGSQILVEKDPRKKIYTTQYKTLQINCESCHGPGRKHIELVRSEKFNSSDIGMEILATFSKDKSLSVCFQCHAVKSELNEGYLPGDDFETYYSTKLPILMADLYTTDGRVNQFAYQQNHLFSDCYVNGSMTCVDCHDPHSQGYRDIFGQPLSGKFDNRQCTGCHASKAEFPERHSKHKKGSKGNSCTSCHMPFLQHRIVGNILTITRSDHVIPIPRPTFDNSIGIENACAKCHKDKSITSLQKEVNDMWGEIKPHNQIITDIIRSEDVINIGIASDLLLRPEINHPIAQFTGLTIFMRRFLKPDMPAISNNILNKLISLSQNKDIDIKSFSLMCIHLSFGFSPGMNEFLYDQLNQAKDNQEAIRLRWSEALYQIGRSYMLKKNYQDAIIVFNKALEIKPYSTVLWNIMGLAYIKVKNYNQSIKAYNNSIKIDPFNTYAYFNIAYAYRLSGDIKKALEFIKIILEYDPDNIEANQILKKNSNF